MTEKELKSLKAKEKRYKVYLGDNIYLEVLPSGKKMFRLKKGPATRTLGEYGKMSLKEARILSLTMEDEILAEKESITFEKILNEWLECNSWSYGTRIRNAGRINHYILPALGHKQVKEIKRLDIVEFVKRIGLQGKNETAKKVLGITKQVLDYAVICGHIEFNYALGLNNILKKRVQKPMAALTDVEDIKRLVLAVSMYDKPVVQSLMKFTMYTLCRPSECRLAMWNEIDFNKKLFIIPAERMKLRKEHVVPLPRQCLELLDIMKLHKENDYIFPSTRPNRPLSDNALLVALRIMGFRKEETTIHGFRSMGSTILNEQGYRPDVIEKALAHAGEDRIRAIYNRAEYLEERRAMLQDYANWLDGLIEL